MDNPLGMTLRDFLPLGDSQYRVSASNTNFIHKIEYLSKFKTNLNAEMLFDMT